MSAAERPSIRIQSQQRSDHYPARLSSDPVVPGGCRRIVLINPTDLLDDLLNAGQLLQCFEHFCHDNGIQLMLVLDEQFRELCTRSFSHAQIVWYPRTLIRNSNNWRAWRLGWACVRAIREFSADIAFIIREDRHAERLLRFSGAASRLGGRVSSRRWISRLVTSHAAEMPDQPKDRQRHWRHVMAVLAGFGMTEPAQCGYVSLTLPTLPDSFRLRLSSLGVDFTRPLVVLHPDSDEHGDHWPLGHYANLAILLTNAGYMPVVIGAGEHDQRAAITLLRQVEAEGHDGNMINLCDRLTLLEMGWLLTISRTIVAGDNPSLHLALSLGVPGIVLSGSASSDSLLSADVPCRVLRRTDVCGPDCDTQYCNLGRQCLETITPGDIINEIKVI